MAHPAVNREHPVAEVDTTDYTDLPDVSARWDLKPLDLSAYLDRIGYRSRLDPSMETLQALVHAHLASIPFEGINPYLGLPVPLDIDSLQDKLVRSRRGGYCHEQNILFGTVLAYLGFEVTLRNARMLMGADENIITGRGHALLSVVVDGVDHHVDVGIGNVGPRGPVPLREGVAMSTGRWTYRFDRSRLGLWVLSYLRPEQGDWFRVVQFDESLHYRSDFTDHNLNASTHESSPFTQQLIASFNGADQRHALVGTVLKTYSPDGEKRIQHLEPEEVPSVLRSVFGVHPTSRVQEALVQRLHETTGYAPVDVRDL